MSASPQPHGQANSVSATARRAAVPVVLAILIAMALAILPGAAVAQMPAVTDGATSGASSVDSYVATSEADAPTMGVDDVRAVGTMGAATTGESGADAPDVATAVRNGDRPAGGGAVSGYGTPTWGAERNAGGIAAAGAERDLTIDPLRADAMRLPAREGHGGPSPALVSERGGNGHIVGAVPGSADGYPQAGSSGPAAGGEQFERPWGLDPSAPLSPATIGGTAIGFLLGAGVFAVAQPRSLRREWFRPASRAVQAETPDRPEPEADDDLVPDEAIVEGMLLRRDGRMKQSAIVDMTDWSKAKVSRLLSTMADEGRVVKVSIGRENLICLNGWEPDAVKGPHAA